MVMEMMLGPRDGFNEVGMIVTSTYSKISWSASPIVYFFGFISAQHNEVQIQGPEKNLSDRFEFNALSGSVTENQPYFGIQIYKTDAVLVSQVF